MELKMAGFFAEQGLGMPELPSLREVVAASPQRDEARIVGYLRRAVQIDGLMLSECDVLFPGLAQIVSDVRGGVRDVRCMDHIPCHPLDIQSDGVWVWLSSYAYYVERYHARIPEELRRHMEQRRWRCRRLGPLGWLVAAKRWYRIHDMMLAQANAGVMTRSF